MKLAEALKIIESGKPFSCKVVTFDKKRGTGGKIREFAEVVYSQPEKSEQVPSSVAKPKAANHYDNFTRNVLICMNGIPSSVIRKLHLSLLLEVNGKKVML